jgi:hypothetical protein
VLTIRGCELIQPCQEARKDERITADLRRLRPPHPRSLSESHPANPVNNFGPVIYFAFYTFSFNERQSSPAPPINEYLIFPSPPSPQLHLCFGNKVQALRLPVLLTVMSDLPLPPPPALQGQSYSMAPNQPKYDYVLHVSQQPVRARMCGNLSFLPITKVRDTLRY